ncbi:MAG TPA: LD-carboxypeptidase [Armatimonadota bacterium]|nr:LD-carboxypeptidase [Armatimonadota bacterium]
MDTSNLNLPPALPRGGTLGIVAPASPVCREAFERGRRALEAQGFRTVLGDHLFQRYGHLAGRDAERAADLHAMFLRDDVDAVLCARGGSGSIRLLRHLDWDLIGSHPKPFLGYSDITSLELALLKRCRLPSFFAPMVTSDFACGPSAFCVENLWRLVCDPWPAGELVDPRAGEATTLVGGIAEGPLVGGTLTLVAATLGTPFEVETDGCVLFFEDVHESPARIERYLTQLLLAGKLEGVTGFLVGNVPWEGSEAEKARYLPEEQVYRDLLEPLGKPLVYGWPHGHDPSPVTLPIGIRVRLDADRKSVTVLDPAVAPRA